MADQVVQSVEQEGSSEQEEIQQRQIARDKILALQMELAELQAKYPENVNISTPSEPFVLAQRRNAAGALTFAQTAQKVADGEGARRRAEELEQQAVNENSAAMAMGEILSSGKAKGLKLPPPGQWDGNRGSLIDWLYSVQTYLVAKEVDLCSPLAVAYSAALLTGAAARFWRMHSTRSVMGQGPRVETFADFRSLVLAQFLPEDREAIARSKLRTLTQGSHPVKTYNDAFSKLIVDLPWRHERDNVDDYVSGLCPELRTLVMMQFPTRVDWAMQLALQIEETQKSSRYGKRSYSQQPTKVVEFSERAGRSGGKGGQASGSSDQAEGSGRSKCFACGSTEHWKRDCPVHKARKAARAVKDVKGKGKISD